MSEGRSLDTLGFRADGMLGCADGATAGGLWQRREPRSRRIIRWQAFQQIQLRNPVNTASLK